MTRKRATFDHGDEPGAKRPKKFDVAVQQTLESKNNVPAPRSVVNKKSKNPNAAYRIGELVWVATMIEPADRTSQANISVAGYEDVDIDRLRNGFVKWPAIVRVANTNWGRSMIFQIQLLSHVAYTQVLCT
jgi:hypothetical protein